MNAQRAGLALFAIALLAWMPQSAQANPALVGAWSAPAPPGMVMTYHFGPGRYLTHHVWCGPLMITLNGQLLTNGTYELRMYSGTEGTVSIRDGEQIAVSVGTVDFSARTFTYNTITYRR